jgi:hypothetical protein
VEDRFNIVQQRHEFIGLNGAEEEDFGNFAGMRALF